MKKITRAGALIGAGLVAATSLTGCMESQSDVADRNLSKEADDYKVFRQIVVYNGVTDKYVLEVRGWCALGNNDSGTKVTYTCKTNRGLVKDIINRSDNIMVFAHQLRPKNVSTKYFKVILRPTTIVPDFDVRD